MDQMLFFNVFFAFVCFCGKFVRNYGIMEISQMNCSLPYSIEKGYKAMSLEIQGLPPETSVIITDKEINSKKCDENPLNSSVICEKHMMFCKSIRLIININNIEAKFRSF